MPVQPGLLYELLLSLTRQACLQEMVPAQPAHAVLVRPLADDPYYLAVLVHVNSLGPTQIKPIKPAAAIANPDLAPVVQVHQGGAEVAAVRVVERLDSRPPQRMALVSRNSDETIDSR